MCHRTILLACGGCNIPTGFLHIWLAPHATVCSRAWVAQKMQSTLNHIWALRKEQNPRNLDLSKEEWSITNQGNMFLSHTKEQVMLMTSPDLLPENTVTTNDNCMAKGYIHIKDTYTLVSLKHFMSINPYFIHVIYNFTSSVKHWRHLQSQQQNSDWKCHWFYQMCHRRPHQQVNFSFSKIQVYYIQSVLWKWFCQPCRLSWRFFFLQNFLPLLKISRTSMFSFTNNFSSDFTLGCITKFFFFYPITTF